jgi:hypothetical protein
MDIDEYQVAVYKILDNSRLDYDMGVYKILDNSRLDYDRRKHVLAMKLATSASWYTNAVNADYWVGEPPLTQSDVIELLGRVARFLSLSASVNGISLDYIMRVDVQNLCIEYPELFPDTEVPVKGTANGE